MAEGESQLITSVAYVIDIITGLSLVCISHLPHDSMLPSAQREAMRRLTWRMALLDEAIVRPSCQGALLQVYGQEAGLVVQKMDFNRLLERHATRMASCLWIVENRQSPWNIVQLGGRYHGGPRLPVGQAGYAPANCDTSNRKWSEYDGHLLMTRRVGD